MINGIKSLHTPTKFQHSMNARCEVCDTIISRLDYPEIESLGYSVCRSLSCRKVMSQKSAMSPQLFKSHLGFNKNLILRQREKNLARKKHIEDVIEKESEENQHILQSMLNEHSSMTAENTHLVEIPSGSSSLIPVSNIRISQYIDHLTHIIYEAEEYANSSEVTHDEHHDAHGKMLIADQRLAVKPQLRELSDSLCTMCKGGCCASGKEHAYLSVFTMRTFMDSHPQLSSDEILEMYISSMSTEVIENSCINHTKTGCALPRELRSDICNGYYCESLKSYQKKIALCSQPGSLVVVQRSSSYWSRFEPGVKNDIVKIALLGDMSGKVERDN